MNFLKISAGVLLLTAVAFPAVADDETSKKKDKNLTLEWTPGPVLKSANEKFQIKLRGRVMWDNAWINDSDNSLNLSATEFRTARMGVEGKFGDDISFIFEADFAHKKVDFKEISIQWKGPLTVRVGHIKFASPMERASSSRFIPLMEPSGYASAFVFSRQFGIRFTKSSENGMIQVGIGQGGFANHGSGNTGFIVAARVTRARKIAGGRIHLGASVRYREIGDNQSNYRYRHRAHQHLSSRFVDTNDIANSDFFAGAEAGFFKGPFAITGEFGILRAALAAPVQGQIEPTFWGGFVNVSYFLTGEDNPYNPESGFYTRPNLKRSVLKGGSGAVQLVVRYDYVDLSDNGILGGIQKTVIVGINWWMAKHLKMVFNYSHSDISQAFLVPANGPDGANKVNAFGIRTQIDW